LDVAKEKQQGSLRIQWVRSAIGRPDKQKRIVRGLGFRKLQQILEKPDTPAIRGMIAKLSHLVVIVGQV
jgi:large subunit ribosomal protein L30